MLSSCLRYACRQCCKTTCHEYCSQKHQTQHKSTQLTQQQSCTSSRGNMCTVSLPIHYMQLATDYRIIANNNLHVLYMHVYAHTHTSVQIIQLNEYGCRMHHAKNRGNKEIPLAILSRILAQSCVTLCLNYVGRVTHDCASILDSIAKGISLFPRFFAWCIPTSIFLNDFYTCSTYFSWFAYKRCNNICSYVRICAHAYMRSTAHLSRVSLVKWRRK